MHPLFDIVRRDLRTDVTQMAEEGHDEAALLREVEVAEATGSMDALLALQEDLWHRPSPPGFPFEEPSDWEAISSTFPDAESHARFAGIDAELADRLLGAWQGRCVGCHLGKPLEGVPWPQDIKEALEAVGSWPLTDYVNPAPPEAASGKLAENKFFKEPWRSTLARGRFDHVAPDDDILYAMVSQLVLEQFGPGFSSEQALGKLIELVPISTLFASGRNMYRAGIFGLKPPLTAIYGNPCRQSLGAQIRCDPWGWGAPANPALAARMAYTDAANSQVRNGIYSGIFFSVLMADTLAHGDPVRAIDTATAHVPPRSRFADMLRFVSAECAAHSDWEVVNAAIYARYPEFARRFNHSIPNAAIVVMALLKGEGAFTRTVGIAVMAGLDTDCNGATVGSVMGCALGTAGIPGHWTAPLYDTIRSQVKDMPQVHITEMAGRLFQAARTNARRTRTRGKRHG